MNMTISRMGFWGDEQQWIAMALLQTKEHDQGHHFALDTPQHYIVLYRYLRILRKHHKVFFWGSTTLSEAQNHLVYFN